MNHDASRKGAGTGSPKGEGRKKTQRKLLGRTVWKVLGTLLLIGCLSGLMVVGSLYYYIMNVLDPQMNVNLADYKLAFTSFVYYTDRQTGKEVVLEKLYDTENRQWVDLINIPKHMQNAAVAIEDERFWKHSGVDWKRTGAAVANLFIGSSQKFGGSTIAQQVVKNVTGDDDYSMMRKIEEILRALNLCKQYSKEEVLEFYLNTAFFSQNTNGVQSASQVYFDKDVSQLSLAESASIIGITQYPGKYDPFRSPENNKTRQEVILRKMLDLDMISNEEYEQAKAEELHFQREKVISESKQVQSWFVDKVINDVLHDLMEQKGYTLKYATSLLYSGGLHIYATVDPDIQKIMDEVFVDLASFPKLAGEEQPQASMTILDPYTGAVVGIAGARGQKTGVRLFNYATDAKRQPGSTIKPLAVYAPALEYGVITEGSVFDDAPVDIEKKYPRNYDSSYTAYRGRTGVKEGVYKSLNTIAMATLQALGPERGFDFITQNLGITTMTKRAIINGKVMSDVDYSPLSMGGLTYGVTNIEMAAAFGTFANKGVYNRPYTYTKVLDNSGQVLLEHVPNATIAMSEQTAFLINDLLQGVTTYGTGTPAQLRNMAVAAKTGTTSDDKDRWFVGYTPYYVGVVWFGYENPREIRYSGTNPALQGWVKVMSRVHEKLPYRSFFSASGIVSATYCKDSGMLLTAACAGDPRGSRAETAYFKKGTAPTEPCSVHVPVHICTESNMLATQGCPDTKVVSLLNIRREFPYSIAIQDEQYTYLPLPESYALPADPTVPVYINLLTPGTNPGYSPNVVGPMNQLCGYHYNLPAYVEPPDPFDPATGQPDPTDPGQNPATTPQKPFDPFNPVVNPGGDSGTPTDPQLPVDNPTEPPEEGAGAAPLPEGY